MKRNKSDLLKLQLKYRKKVLKDRVSKSRLLNISSGGKKLSVKEMRENLREVLGGTGTSDVADEQEMDAEQEVESESQGVKADELIGRLLIHRTESEGKVEDSTCWIVEKRDGDYVFRYDGVKDEYEYTRDRVEEDLKNGDLREMDVTVKDVVGRDIEYMWLNDDGEEVWYAGRVVSEGDNGMCVVEYEAIEDESDEEWESEVLAEPLIEDYRKREVRFV